MTRRLLFMLKSYLMLILFFVSQKVVFMLVNVGHADGAPFGSCVAALWHGLRLDTAMACYILVMPLIVLVVSSFFVKINLRAVLRPWWWLSAVLMAVVFVADTVLYLFWGAKIDANDLIYAAKPKDMLASVKWWSIVAGIAVIAATVWIYGRCLCRITPTSVPRHNRWLSLIYIPLAGLLFLGVRGDVSESTANPSYAYFSKHQFCNHAALNPFFNMVHSLFKTEDLLHGFDFLSGDEAVSKVAPLFATGDDVTDTLLRCRRPDILMIVWEGGGKAMVMNDSVGENLMRYCDEGVVFNSLYSNNFRTDRGLVSLLSGWQGLPTTSLMKMNDKCRKLPSLARELANVGYNTSFVYGGDIDFTNMRGYMLETGFEKAVGSEAFPESRRLSGWGAPDACTLLPSLMGGESPSFDVFLTLSSHEPWTVPMRRLRDDRKNSFAYTDSCIGVMVDSLRHSPRWDSLLIIIVPDHGVALSSSQSTSDPAVAPIPMVWIGGAVNGHHEVDVMMNQSDLAATLLAQMGLSHKSFPLSRNVLSAEYADNYHFALHCFKNGCNLFDNEGITRFDCASRSATDISGTSGEDRSQFVKTLLQAIYHITGHLGE